MHSHLCPTFSRNPSQLSRIVLIVFGIAFLACLPQKNSYAWGIVGHRIVCEIAFNRLTQDTQNEVNTLVQAFIKPNGKRFGHFRESCTFADTARHNARDGYKRWRSYERYDRWHYLNVPRNTQRLAHAEEFCKSDCVLHAIAFHSRKISNSKLPDAERGEAVILLAHWVADVHQPLHIGFADDHGGNDTKITPKARLGKNLHSVWDAGLLKHLRGRRKLKAYVAELSKIPTGKAEVWLNANSAYLWAGESYSLATSPALGYCRWVGAASVEKSCRAPSKAVRVDHSYITNNGPLVERRLQQAGVRLAAALTTLLNDSEN